jgi:uncharacterized damage-inducible protein DinB
MSDNDTRRHPADVPDAPVVAVRNEDRQIRPPAGDEKSLLEAFLNFHRDTLLWKISGLTDEELRKVWTPSGMSLLGLVKHLAFVEHNWFEGRFMGGTLLTPWVDDPDCDFRINADETAASVIAVYREKVAQSQRIVAQAESLEIIAKAPERPHSLRRIMVHMIGETSRHCGHADFMREFTDGQTGE